MKLHKIGYSYTEHGSVSVLADTEDKAVQVLEGYLEMHGLDDIDSVFKEYETHHREYDAHKEYE